MINRKVHCTKAYKMEILKDQADFWIQKLLEKDVNLNLFAYDASLTNISLVKESHLKT